MTELLSDALAGWGCHVDAVCDPRLALDKMREVAYDLVIGDLKMPELDGPTLQRLADKQEPGLAQRFVFITGDTLSPGVSEFLEKSGRPFLVKPFRLDDCARVIHAALTSSGRRQH